MDVKAALALEKWSVAVTRYRAAEAAFGVSHEAWRKASAEVDQARPPLPDELSRLLYFGDIPCLEHPQDLDRTIVRKWLKISGLAFVEWARLERAFVDWLARCDEIEIRFTVTRLRDHEQGLDEARRAAYEAVIHTPAPMLEILVEKVAIAAELLDGFALDAIREDLRRLVAQAGTAR